MKITVEVEFATDSKAIKFLEKLTRSKICQQENVVVQVKTAVKSDEFREKQGIFPEFESNETENTSKNLLTDPPWEGVGGGEKGWSTVQVRHKATLVAGPSDAQASQSTTNEENKRERGKSTQSMILAQAKRVSVPDLESTEFEVSPGAQIRSAYVTLYSERYGKAAIWGARENGQAKYLLKHIGLAEALELIPAYFKWSNAQVIRAGHPFGMGYASFMQRYSELRADLVAPERHAMAIAMDSKLRESGRQAEASLNVDIAMRQMQSEQKKKIGEPQ